MAVYQNPKAAPPPTWETMVECLTTACTEILKHSTGVWVKAALIPPHWFNAFATAFPNVVQPSSQGFSTISIPHSMGELAVWVDPHRLSGWMMLVEFENGKQARIQLDVPLKVGDWALVMEAAQKQSEPSPPKPKKVKPKIVLPDRRATAKWGRRG